MKILTLLSRGLMPPLLSALLAFASFAPARATETKSPPATERKSDPFARIYLALRGCTSCSHCRTTIRQMARASAGAGEARLNGDRIEVSYATPKPVPLRDVIRRLAENRLHDLSLVDVLFEARGSITDGPGGAVFILSHTGQRFSVEVDPSIPHPPKGVPVRLVARVDGWREKGEIRLVAREIREGV